MKNISFLRKTLLLAFLWMLIAWTPSLAQWNIGGLLNLSATNVVVDPDPSSEEYTSRFGFGIGGVLDRPLTGQFDLHLEPMYLQKGTTIEEDGEDIAFKFAYLELPVMVRYNFQTSGNTMPYAMAGPNLGYLLGAKYEVDGSEFDAKDQIKSVDFGIGIGGGAKIPKDNLLFFGEARYVLGIANVNDDESDGTTVKHRGLQIVFGVTIPLQNL